jgi:hypothetical protein
MTTKFALIASVTRREIAPKLRGRYPHDLEPSVAC